MIYDKPIIRELGELCINVEFGDEVSIPLNFRILALDLEIKENAPKGVIETNPQVRSLGIIFDPMVTKKNVIIDFIKEITLAQSEVDKLPSRRLIIPAWYNDPWSQECANAFNVRNNIEYIAEFNNMTVDQVIENHTGCDYWVTGVGFVPGTFVSYAMDPKKRFGAPLYRTPRTWTYARLLNFGGTTSTIYPIKNPGGGQLFGRTPINIFEPEQKNAIFKDSPVLARTGDRHRYVSITKDEYYEIRSKVKSGTYEYEIEDGVFECGKYIEWLKSIGEPLEKVDENSEWR